MVNLNNIIHKLFIAHIQDYAPKNRRIHTLLRSTHIFIKNKNLMSPQNKLQKIFKTISAIHCVILSQILNY